MELSSDMIRDINLAVNYLANDYFYTKQYDEEGHAYDMRWVDCVDHGNDDFCRDVVGWMECYGYELSPEQADAVRQYAEDHVTYTTIAKYAVD